MLPRFGEIRPKAAKIYSISALFMYRFNYSEPAYRGVMIAYVNVSVTIGMLLVFVLNTLMAWRVVALVSLALPIITTIALAFVSFFFFNLNRRKILFSLKEKSPIKSHFFSRFLNLPYGYYQRTKTPMQKRLCVGFVVGFKRKILPRSLTLSKVTVNDPNLVTTASNKM